MVQQCRVLARRDIRHADREPRQKRVDEVPQLIVADAQLQRAQRLAGEALEQHLGARADADDGG